MNVFHSPPCVLNLNTPLHLTNIERDVRKPRWGGEGRKKWFAIQGQLSKTLRTTALGECQHCLSSTAAPVVRLSGVFSTFASTMIYAELFLHTRNANWTPEIPMKFYKIDMFFITCKKINIRGRDKYL